MTQVKKDKDYVSQKFGIPLQEFEEMLNASPASYKDYPNNEKWLTLIYIVYNKIFQELTTESANRLILFASQTNYQLS